MRLVNANNTMFRNIYCALCNGIEADDIKCGTNTRNIRKYNPPDRSKLQEFLLASLFALKNEEMLNKITQVSPKSILNCITTRLNESEYYITNDGLLYLKNTHSFLNQSEFTRASQGINICVKNGAHILGKYSEAEDYITFVGLVISIPALAITIIVYLCIPDLRTLPDTSGKFQVYKCN
ncbi:Hypothetical predicted protein [Octopus vulgaris]|uniref:Uncharacterized protein n=1 Tax=Octopus vulgaris TaxID=6645 RepID=A0AA36F7X5_OCTVU|nr:Hypothetical predicted protein [Octopus vulgaris]